MASHVKPTGRFLVSIWIVLGLIAIGLLGSASCDFKNEAQEREEKRAAEVKRKEEREAKRQETITSIEKTLSLIMVKHDVNNPAVRRGLAEAIYLTYYEIWHAMQYPSDSIEEITTAIKNVSLGNPAPDDIDGDTITKVATQYNMNPQKLAAVVFDFELLRAARARDEGDVGSFIPRRANVSGNDLPKQTSSDSTRQTNEPRQGGGGGGQAPASAPDPKDPLGLFK